MNVLLLHPCPRVRPGLVVGGRRAASHQPSVNRDRKVHGLITRPALKSISRMDNMLDMAPTSSLSLNP